MTRKVLGVLVFLVSLPPLGAPPVAAAGDGPLESLAWLAGCWQGEAGEECWLPAAGGIMLGVNRGPEREGESTFEFLRIVVGSDGVPVYLASPGGRCPATPFLAVELAEGRVVFANPEHDFPQRITYWLDGEGVLHARVEARGDGFELRWQRAGWKPE